MPLQNRVDPFGTFHSIPAKGTLMGNRGILHDDQKHVICTHAHQNWVACTLSFKGRRREIMSEGRYTELFFFDEATAFAAGHRPCAECRRARYNEFTSAWKSLHGEPEAGRSLPHTIDRHLHAHRIARGGKKVTFEADAGELPDGTIFAFEGAPVLAWRGTQYDWSFAGYRERADLVVGQVIVLTPRPIVELFSAGFEPHVLLPDNG